MVRIRGAKTIIILASNGKLRDKHVQSSISEKMEVKRLTGERYSLHFEVCTRDPIGVGKRNGRTTVKPDIQKPSVGAEGFCLSEAGLTTWLTFVKCCS
jgi:hypothetical protein